MDNNPSAAPTVSVVIPTRNRSELLQRAIRSVLDQSFRNFELVIVIDGPDERTQSVVDSFGDSRIRALQLASSTGGSAARNAGVVAARGPWIAFLDDDDEWLPEKLKAQLSATADIDSPHIIIACQIMARSPRGTFVWPRRLPRPDEDISDYLLARRSWFHGEGTIQTGMLLVTKELLQLVPFDHTLKRHQETDWILRAARVPEFFLHYVEIPLAVWYFGEHRSTITAGVDWKHSLAWIRSRKGVITKRAYADFVLVNLAHQAKDAGQWNASWKLLYEAFRHGSPGPYALALFWVMWLVPQAVRQHVRSWVSKLNLRLRPKSV
jgi:glycosyltransferase involved in cell wall biosynthesis